MGACADTLAVPFQKLLQHSLDRGVIPDRWKQSLIISVPKKNRHQGMKYLRPVSLTMVRMNCLDKIVLRRLRGLLEEVSPAPGAYQFACHLEWIVNDAADNDPAVYWNITVSKNNIC